MKPTTSICVYAPSPALAVLERSRNAILPQARQLCASKTKKYFAPWGCYRLFEHREIEVVLFAQASVVFIACIRAAWARTTFKRSVYEGHNRLLQTKVQEREIAFGSVSNYIASVYTRQSDVLISLVSGRARGLLATTDEGARQRLTGTCPAFGKLRTMCMIWLTSRDWLFSGLRMDSRRQCLCKHVCISAFGRCRFVCISCYWIWISDSCPRLAPEVVQETCSQ